MVGFRPLTLVFIGIWISIVLGASPPSRRIDPTGRQLERVEGYHGQDNRDVTGWTLSQYPGLSIHECAKKCNMLSECRGFTYITNFKKYGEHFGLRYNCFAKSGTKMKRKAGAAFYINQQRTRVMRQEGKRPEYHPRVKCLSDSIKVVVDMSNLPKQDFDVYKLHAGSNGLRSTCRSYAHGKLRILKFLLVDCNPFITETEDEIVYTYTIGANTHDEDHHLKRKRRSFDSDKSVNRTHRTRALEGHHEHVLQRNRRDITRAHRFGVEVICRYKRKAVIQASYVGNVYTIKYRGSATGQFKFSMALYMSAKFSSAYKKGSGIRVGTTVYPRIDFLSSSDVDMYVQDCYAVPVQGGGAYHLSFIKPGGCFGDDKTFSQILATNKSYAFKFDVFRFRGLKSNQLMLKCDMFLCRKDSAGKGKCRHPRKCGFQKRDLDKKLTYPVTIGPFNIV